MRTNERWLEDLRSTGKKRETALEDLTRFLRAGLLRSLSDSGGVDPTDVEDFAQDAVLRILAGLRSYRGDSRFTTWAMAIALRTAYTELRKRRFADVSLSDIEEYGGTLKTTFEHETSPAERDLQRSDLIETLHRAVYERLSDRQRTVILAELQGIASGRVAELLGSNRNAVYKVYHDARRKLRVALVDEGFSAADVGAIVERA